MALSAPVKAAALLLFLAALAGATYGVEQVVGSTVESQLLTATAPRSELNATAGHTVTYVVAVANRDTAAREVVLRVSGAAQGESVPTTVLGNASAGIFVPVAVPATALPGEHALKLSLESGGRVLRETDSLLTLRVLPPGVGFAPGDTASAIYVGRLSATGRVFNTNDQAIVGVPFPKTDSYRFSQQELRVQSLPQPSVIEGLYQGMLGMQAGESRTISFPSELGYGNATEEERSPRDETIPRVLTVTNEAQRVPRATFDAYINESRQGDPAAFEVGDIFRLEQNGNAWPYAVANISATSVEYRLAAKVGEAYTVYPFWTNASVVSAIDDKQVSFETRPTTQVGETFTYRAHWPKMSALLSETETGFVVRHSPPVGFSYTKVTQLGQPREYTVAAVDETTIVEASPSTNPLAGKALTFDITVLSLTR